MSDRDETVLPAGTYRVLDGRLYRVEPGLPPSLDTRDAEIATLRTRAEQAEAERDRATFAARASGADLLRIGVLCGMTDDEYPLKAVERVVAEVARLREEQASWDRQSMADWQKLRAQFEAAVAERDEARDQRDGSFEDVASLNGCLERATARAEAAEAEVARLRAERDDVSIHAASRLVRDRLLRKGTGLAPCICRVTARKTEWPITLGLSIRRFVRRAEVEELVTDVRHETLRHDYHCNNRRSGCGCRGDRAQSALDRLAAMAMEGHGDG